VSYDDALADVRRGTIRPFYLLHGNEPFLIREFLTTLEDSMAALYGFIDRLRLEGPDAPIRALEALRMSPLLGGARLVEVRDEEGGSGAVEVPPEAWIQGLKSYVASVPGDSALVWVRRKADKRTSLYKLARSEGCEVQCDAPTGGRLAAWVHSRARAAGKEMEQEAVEMLLASVGGDLGALASEVEKLALFVGDGPTIGLEDVRAAAAGSAQGDIFALLDEMGRRRPGPALGLLRGLRQRGEPPVRIIFMLARQVRLMLRAAALDRRGLPPREIASACGVPPFVVRKCLEQGHNFSEGELRDALLDLHRVDAAVKTGGLPPDSALEMFLVRFCARDVSRSSLP